MFRQKKIGDRLPLSTGVGEGSHRLKKALKILLISVICFMLVVCPFSVAALDIDNLVFTPTTSKIWDVFGSGKTFNCTNIYSYQNSKHIRYDYDYLTSNDIKGSPFASYQYFNCQTQKYGTLKITMYCEFGNEDFGGIYFDSFNGLYDDSGNKIADFKVEEQGKYTLTYTGDFVGNYSLRAYFVPNWVNNNGLSFLLVDMSFSEKVKDTSKDIIDNDNKNTDKIVGAIENQKEQEKQEAQSSGNDSVDMVQGALSKYGTDNIFGILSAFVSPMQHNNTDCILTLPALKIPELKIDKYNITIPSITLLEKQQIIFSEGKDAYDNVLSKYFPRSVVLIIRWSLTITLYIFCYKEFYSLLQYVLTLRSGGNKDNE